MDLTVVGLYVMVVTYVLGAAGSILTIGQPRKPITPGMALTNLIIWTIWVIVLINAIPRVANG